MHRRQVNLRDVIKPRGFIPDFDLVLLFLQRSPPLPCLKPSIEESSEDKYTSESLVRPYPHRQKGAGSFV
jgi:hypothetical protein